LSGDQIARFGDKFAQSHSITASNDCASNPAMALIFLEPLQLGKNYERPL
jgi:hypothetical protein